MINTDQINAIIDRNDDLFTALIDLATHDDAELHRITESAESLHALALQHSTSPATICRFAQYLTNPDNYIAFCNAYEICPIHRCDYQICIDDELHD